jgi:hypothetical protein
MMDPLSGCSPFLYVCILVPCSYLTHCATAGCATQWDASFFVILVRLFTSYLQAWCSSGARLSFKLPFTTVYRAVACHIYLCISW